MASSRPSQPSSPTRTTKAGTTRPRLSKWGHPVAAVVVLLISVLELLGYRIVSSVSDVAIAPLWFRIVLLLVIGLSLGRALEFWAKRRQRRRQPDGRP